MASADSYLVKFTVGNVGEPGAPILHVTAVVDAVKGTLNGSGEITQAIAGPNSVIHIPHITGEVHSLGYLMEIRRVAALKGSFGEPPTMIIQGFSASLLLEDETWTGQGSFKYGVHEVANVPVALAEAPVPQPA